MLVIDVFRNILYHFTFFFSNWRRRKMTYMPWNLYFLRFSSRFSFRLFGTTRQDLYRVGCMLQFNNAIYHSPYLSMKISFNRGKSHLILFFHRCFSFFHQKHTRTKENRKKLDLGSLSLQGDGIWLVIAFLFHSLFPFCKRFILEKVMNFFLGEIVSFLSRDISSQNLLSFLINIYERETISKKQDTYFAWSRCLIFNRRKSTSRWRKNV